jgi:PPOX class probable FMN-dependent enzyme
MQTAVQAHPKTAVCIQNALAVLRTVDAMDSGCLTEITSETQLREVLGEPLAYVANKDRRCLHEYDKQWLASSPLCLVATSGADGSCDVSPKGDPPGFTLVLDDTTIAIPERRGNRRADGFRNILTNPHVGLVYLIPGRGDTLRINGRARLVREAPFFDQLTVKGHRPLLALIVELEQIFYHCPKAFLRSDLWRPDTWDPTAVPSKAQIAQRLERPDETLEHLQHYYGPAYATRLY